MITWGVATLDIHKPKPIHGLRAFIAEVGIIVLGVLIALGAEQLVLRYHIHEQMAAGEDALTDDYASLVANARERERESPCLGRRLDELAAIIERADQTGRLPPLGDIGSPHSRTWTSLNWRSLVASGVATRFDHDKISLYSSIATSGDVIDRAGDEELDDWAVLYSMVGPGRSIDAGTRQQLYATLSRARYHAKFMRLVASQISGAITETNLPFEKRTGLDLFSLPNGVCLPIGQAPPHYGQAPFRMSLDGPLPK